MPLTWLREFLRLEAASGIVLICAAAIAVLNGCGFVEPFTPPKVVAGNESTLTLSTGSLRDASTYAQRYCAKYGKRAVLTTRGKMTERAVTIYLYDCLPAQTR